MKIVVAIRFLFVHGFLFGEMGRESGTGFDI